MSIPPRVTVVEVGPRDGLHNQPCVISTTTRLVHRPVVGGRARGDRGLGVRLSEVDAADADAADVFAGIAKRPGVRYRALVPKLAGLGRAIAANVNEVAIFAAVSETFSQRNSNQSIAASFAAHAAVRTRATDAGLKVRGYLSICFGCPYEGDVPADRVADMARRMLDLARPMVSASRTADTEMAACAWLMLGRPN